MSLWIEKQETGTLIVPIRAEAAGIIGDGVIEVKPNDPDYKTYLKQYNDEQSRMSDNTKKQKSYTEAARLLAIVERAGARHSATDRSLVQQLHDIAMELGAECYHDEGETLTVDDLRRYAPNPMLKAAIEEALLKLLK